MTFRQDCGMDLAEPARAAFLGSQGWLGEKPTVQERPSHVGPWFTRRPLGRRLLTSVCASMGPSAGRVYGCGAGSPGITRATSHGNGHVSTKLRTIATSIAYPPPRTPLPQTL